MKIDLREDHNQISGQWAFSPGDKPVPFSKTTSSTDFLAFFDENANSDFGIMPPAVRYISPSRKTVIFERLPAMQTITYYPAHRDEVNTDAYSQFEKNYTFTIPLPWTLYIVTFDTSFWPVEIRMFFRNDCMQSLDDPVWLPPMLNFYTNGTLCPPITETYEASGNTLGDGIQVAYNRVWNSGTNLDLRDAISYIENGKPSMIYEAFRRLLEDTTRTWNIHDYRPHFTAWESLGIADVLQIQDWPWPTLDKVGRKPLLKQPTIRDFLTANAFNAGTNPTKEFMTRLVNFLA